MVTRVGFGGTLKVFTEMEQMPSPSIDTPEALNAAIATARQTRRKKLLHVAEGKAIRIRLAYGCTAFVALCAVGAVWAGDRLAVALLGILAYVVVTVVCITIRAARRRALRELQEMELTT